MNTFLQIEHTKITFPLAILLMFFAFTNSLFTQTFLFDKLDIKDGLSQGAVQCVIQDDDGFIWIGTQDGLNRFDGYNFKIFKHDPADSNSLSENYIQKMLKDRTGKIWIGTINGGLERFDPSTEWFKHFKNNPDNPNSLGSDIVISLLEDKEGTIWVGTYGGGLNRYDSETESFTHYINDPDNSASISNNIILDIFEDSEGILWVGTMGGGLNKFNNESNQFIHYLNESENPNSLSHNRVWEIKEDKSGTLWIGTMGGGLNKLNKETGEFIRYHNNPKDPQSLHNNVIQDIFINDSGTFWLATNEGVSLFNVELETFEKLISKTGSGDEVKDLIVQDIFKDKGDVLWISTFGGGIFKYDPNRIKFKHFKKEEADKNSLSNNQVYTIQGDPSNSDLLWVGTFGGGLNKLNLKSGRYTYYQNEPGNPQSISSNHIQVIYFDHDGILWIGTVGNGLNRYNRERNNFTRLQHDPEDPKSLSNDRIRSIYEDKNNILWIGTYGGGLNKFNRETGEFTHYNNQPGDSTSLSNDIVKVLYEDSGNRFWVGTVGAGLNLFNRDENKFTRFINDPKDPQSISNNVIQCVNEDINGNLWISTFGGGLNRYEQDKNSFEHFTEKDGLPHNSLYDILTDDRENLWISTSRGLTKFNPLTKSFHNYSTRDGLQGEDFNSGAYYKNKTGEMFFGGQNGFNSFHPDSISNNQHIPALVLTRFQKFNKDVRLSKPIHQLEKLELTYEDYVFSFEFSALDYAFPDKNNYAYIMEGFESDWNYSGNRRFVTYTNLDPGEYVFRVKGSNNDGVWNESGTALSIIISPPFWQTWWFTSLSAGFILFVIVLIIAMIKTREQKMAEIDKKIADLKMQALASQMKPHFVFNIINSIQYLISDNNQKAALDYMSKFASLLRLSLDNSLKSTISISDEIKFLNLYLELEQFRFENKFVYEIKTDSSIDIDSTEIPVMCIQPVVENAVIHGLSQVDENGKLSIYFHMEAEKFYCIVIDNGPGINKTIKMKKESKDSHKSLGIKITEERLRLLLQKGNNEVIFDIKNLVQNGSKETGTSVKIRLPITVR